LERWVARLVSVDALAGGLRRSARERSDWERGLQLARWHLHPAGLLRHAPFGEGCLIGRNRPQRLVPRVRSTSVCMGRSSVPAENLDQTRRRRLQQCVVMVLVGVGLAVIFEVLGRTTGLNGFVGIMAGLILAAFFSILAAVLSIRWSRSGRR
jgi:hypothetical protein